MDKIKTVDLQPGMTISNIEMTNRKIRTVIRLSQERRIRIYFNNGEYFNLPFDCYVTIE